MKRPLKVAICVLTYKRPTSLKRTLESLQQQKNIKHQHYLVKIIVIDNDQDSHCGDFVDTLNKEAQFPVELAQEPVKGIPYARNKAVELARADDALIFIDDDEVAPDNWLYHILNTWVNSGADVVTGPVHAKLPVNAPNWAIKSQTFSDLREFKTGHIVDKAYTNNVLISTKIFETITPAFDTFFRYTGSEDINFFQKVYNQEYQIVWCAEAIVYEVVPQTRLNMNWIIKRSFRNGSGDAISRLRINHSIKSYLKVFVMGCGRIYHGIQNIIIGAFSKSYTPYMRGVRLVVSGVGTFAGMIGINYEEYRITHGE